MPTDLAAVLAIHTDVMAELDKHEAEIEEREREANKTLADCSIAKKEIVVKRHRLKMVEVVYREYLGALPNDPLPLDLPERAEPQSAEEKPKRRARIGPQRYRILHVMRQSSMTTSEALTEATIAERSGLSAKRVRDQIRQDLSDGVVNEPAEGFYGITQLGDDLMTRFEAYKKSRGQPLPALSGPVSDDGEDDNDDLSPENNSAKEIAA